MRKLFSVLSLVLLYVTIAFGQAAIEIPITVQDSNGNTQILLFGLDPAATGGIDLGLEAELPPPSPAGAFDVRFVNVAGQSTLGQGSWKDIRNAPAFPFTGSYTHRVLFQAGDPNWESQTITISWNLPPEILATSSITNTNFGGSETASFSGIGSMTIPFPVDYPRVQIVVNYSNINVFTPEPGFLINPLSYAFGSVFVGANSSTTANISNTGDADLVVQQPAPVGAFSVTGPFPITIAEGGAPVPVTVTFAPTAEGPQQADLSFAHNADGTPYLFHVTGTGAGTAPIFRVEPTALNFGLVPPTTSVDLTVTVYNDGLVDALNVNATTAAPFSVNPPSFSIPAGGNHVFTVTFTPPTNIQYNGTLVFTHNGASSPDEVSLVGFGYVPAAVNGLVFDQDTVYRLEDNSYMNVMQLKDVAPGEFIKAFQFRLYTNQAIDDHTTLTFQGITKGANLSSPTWVLDYNVFRGPITANGASQDEIYVLVYNLNQGPGWTLGPGNWDDLLHVTYRVADLPALTDSIKSSIMIHNAEASSFEGFPIDITPSDSELVVIAKNRISSLGDVNGDGCLDILDLIMVVDHIVGRDSLDDAEFARADIAPWTSGPETLPEPDGFVNVQDLSLIQNIILTGFFPDGTPVGDCSYAILPKVEGEADAEVNVYITSEGITVYLDTKVGIRGAQMEFDNITNNPGNLEINTDLGQGYYLFTDKLLRTLMYDRMGVKYIPQGTHFMADMPFTIANPENIVLDKLVLVDINTQRVMSVQVNIFYTPAPVPLDYILFQNYPNPFNPSTSVKFQVPQTSDVTIKVFDMLGQEVRTLFTGEVLRGNYTVEWDGLNDAGQQMSSGSYIYRMIAGEFMQAKKMVYVK